MKLVEIEDIPTFKKHIQNLGGLWVYSWNYLWAYSFQKNKYILENNILNLYDSKGNLLILPEINSSDLNCSVVFSDDRKIEGFTKSKKDEDFVYDNTEFIKMEGKKWKNLRNSVSRGKREGLVVRNFEEKDKAIVLNLTSKWKKEQGIKYFRLMDGRYTKNAIIHFEKLDLWGLILEHNGEIVGYSFSGSLNEEEKMAFCFISKTLNSSFFYSDYLYYSTIKQNLEKGYLYTNYAGSVGNKGLKNYKEKLNPCKKIKLYSLQKKDEPTNTN